MGTCKEVLPKTNHPMTIYIDGGGSLVYTHHKEELHSKFQDVKVVIGLVGS
jgi:hypothetical protein